MERSEAQFSTLESIRQSAGGASIPAVIFQTWKSRVEVPSNYARWMTSFDRMNSSFHHVLWDDDDNRAFIAAYFPWFLPTYDRYPKEIYRADAVRYWFLYAFGGVYADMDAECLKPLTPLLNRADVLLGRMGPEPKHPHSIPNATMASRPLQEFWLLVIALLMNASASAQYTAPDLCTGPVILKSAADLYLGQTGTRAGARGGLRTGLRTLLRVRRTIREVASHLPRSLRPTHGRSKLEILPSREWFALDWTDAIHQRLRREVIDGAFLDEASKQELFPDSSVVSYWTHSW